MASRGRKHLDSQLTFGYARRKGHRVGRPRVEGSGVPHLTRDRLASRFPVHVVLRVEEGLPRLRAKEPYEVLRRCFRAGCDRFGFRLSHYSVQGNHLHLIVEARDREALSRGMKGLGVRIAKGLNRLWGRKGRVLADRYFEHILRTPLEVKRALAYVLKNNFKHEVLKRRVDIFSSGMWFDGWREIRVEEFEVSEPPCVSPARTWLLRVGWRRHGLIPVA